METNKPNKPYVGLPFYTLTFIVSLLFELYWILNRPYEYFMLIGIGIIAIITGYLTIDNIIKAKAMEMAERQQQNETMIKAQKAIYLATKKNSVEAEKTREQNIKTLEVLMTSMVSSQKELVNVITTKSDELASKQIGMNDNSADVSELVEKLSKSNDRLAKQVQDAMTINELVKANAKLVESVQNMFNGTTPEVQPTFTAPVYEEPEIQPEELNSIPVDDIAPIVMPDPIMEEVENTSTDDISSVLDDLGLDELLDDDAQVDTLGDIDINSISNDIDMNTDDINNEINNAKMEEAEVLEDMTVAEDVSPELDKEMSASMDEKDPNAPLSEEEIAALFASL